MGIDRKLACSRRLLHTYAAAGRASRAALASTLRERGAAGVIWPPLERAIGQGAAIDAADDSGATALLSADRAARTPPQNASIRSAPKKSTAAPGSSARRDPGVGQSSRATVRLLLDAGARSERDQRIRQRRLTFAILARPAIVRALLDGGAQ